MSNWICIQQFTTLPEAALAKNLLDANGIAASVLNKQDSSYLNFGYIELLVPEAQVEAALQLLNQPL
jgi:Putative prokaryotic signal transducing protein